MFNSREYQWSDVAITVGGRLISGARAVSYKVKREKEALYGKGDEPVSIQHGNKSYDGTLTVTTSEYNALVEAGGGTLLDLQCDVTVSYGDPAQGDVMRTDKLVGVEFTEEPDDWKQGDKFEEHALPFIFLRKRQG